MKIQYLQDNGHNKRMDIAVVGEVMAVALLKEGIAKQYHDVIESKKDNTKIPSQMNKKELLEWAKEMNVEIEDDMTKKEIIALVKEKSK